MAPLPRSLRESMQRLRTSDRRLFLVMAAVAALVAIDAVLACLNTLRLHETVGKVAHTHRVLATLERSLASTMEAETQQRSYLITGDLAFFEQYRAARSQHEQALAELDTLIADNPAQVARAATLRGHLTRRFAIHEEGISARREGGVEAVQQIIPGGPGQDALDAARATVDLMLEEEQRLLDQRVLAAKRSRTISLTGGITAGVVALLAIGGFVRLLHRQTRERRIAAATLYAEKELFRTTLASIGDGVITTDTTGRVTFLNSIAEQLTGWSTGEADGEPLETVFHILHEDTGASVENPARRALRDGVVVGLANHTVLRTRGGDDQPIDDSAAPIRAADGSIIGAVLVFRDVTARRSAERALLDADRRKDRFLALLAHELRNPLAPLRNSLELMQLTRDPGQLAGIRGVMERQVAQMVRLVDDLLDVSRIAGGKHEMRFEVVDIAVVVASALETFRPVLEQSGEELVTTLPDKPRFLRADPIRLAQVLYNLLNNAAKFSDPGSRIFLAVEDGGDELVLRVRDEGVGIPPDQLDRIFEMFEQVDQSLERSRSGLGVGLTLVRRIVERHGGTVVARSEGPGRGSEFVVTLPCVAMPRAAPPAPQPAPAGPGRRILVADDNLDAADSLSLLLRLRGHEVRVVHDGHRAVEAAESFRPDVVLLDIGMPGKNGYEVARAIREQLFGRDRLLVAVTGWGSADDQRRTSEAGFDHHLVKPIDIAALDALLSQASPTRT